MSKRCPEGSLPAFIELDGGVTVDQRVLNKLIRKADTAIRRVRNQPTSFVALTALPPDQGDLASFLFHNFVLLLSSASQSTFQLLLKLNISCFLAASIMAYLYLKNITWKLLHAVILLISGFIGMLIPVGFITIQNPKLKAFVLTFLLIVGPLAWSFIFPVFFQNDFRKQKPIRISIALTFVLLVCLNTIFRRFQ